MEIKNITFEEAKEIFKKSIDTADTKNQAIENFVQSIYLKGYNDAEKENSEIKNEVKDLSKRVEILEKQIKEDKEEQLNKLKAELDYAKFRCALPTITNMMSGN